MKFLSSALQGVALLASMQATIGFAKAPFTRSALSGVLVRAYRTQAMTSLGASKMDQSFPTWTYDEPCKSVEWSQMAPVTMSVTSDSAGYEESDLVIVGIFGPEEEEEDSDESKTPPPVVLTGLAKEIDEKLGGALTEIAEENGKAFKAGGATGSTTPTLRVAGATGKRYMLVGLGKSPKEELDSTVARKVGATIASKCNDEKKITSCAVVLPESFRDTLSELSCSFYASMYSDNRYRTGDKVKKTAEDLTSVTIVTNGGSNEALAQGQKLATGVFLAKDIVNSPHNVMNSLSLADTAKRIAEESNGRLTCKILGKAECEERGMGAYLGVARGSETEPQFIHLTYSSPNPTDKDKKVAVIGKGLLFDTGGYNIKTAMMELMKFDCGGAAAVLGAARAVAATAPEGVEAHFLVAACENMINQKAIVPSDVLTASNGKTIEVVNTDAEGRLTLADALVYADKEVGCEACIELSTLTGACMVALGKEVCGIWTSNDDLAEQLESVSKDTGDKSWRMPLETAYNEQLDSKIADMTNCGTRWGGSITAALFLQKFMDKKKPFAHIDIAGPVWNEKTGATGFGSRMVAEWVRRQGIPDKE